MGLFSGILGTLGTVFGGPIGGAIGGLAGGLFESNKAEQGVADQNYANAAQAFQAQEFSAEQAQLNREFQERMSGSSWQRGTKDMMAAGINPMLAVSQGGASSPSGSSAQGVNARMENVKAAGLQQELAIQGMRNQTALAESQTKLNEAAAAKAAAEVENVPLTGQQISAQTAKLRVEVDEVRERIKNIFQDTSLKIDQGNLARVNQELSKVNALVAGGQLPVQDAQVALSKVQALTESYRAEHSKLDLDRSKAESRFYGSDVGQASAAVRFITEILRVLSFVTRR